MTGDGIYLGAAVDPVVENCVIYNDIPYTHWLGRIGLTVEHNCSNAIIRNNFIGGYNSDIHIEITYGGHEISNNTLIDAVTGITLNEPTPPKTDPKYAEYMAKAKPNKIKNNVFAYNFGRQ